MRTIVLVFAVVAGCRSKSQQCEAPAPQPQRDFAGCLYYQYSWRDQWRCEDPNGTWICNEEQNRASCVWEKPLPPGHPLLHAEQVERVAGAAK